MSEHEVLWQSFLGDLGLGADLARSWQGYVITVNAPEDLGLTRVVTESGVGMIEAPLAGPIILRLDGKPAPCQFQPMAGANRHFRLSASDCENLAKAEEIHNWWWAYHGAGISLKAADYNNVGCAAMWKQPPDEKLARQMFQKALQQGGGATEIITHNLKLLDSPRPKPLPVPREAIVEALQNKKYAPLLHWADDDMVMLGVLDYGEGL